MIKKIRIKEVATYDSVGIEINLKKINYIFGSNGTGKTTISESLRNLTDYSNSSIEWNEHIKHDIFVYNRNFVRENFSMRNIKGIFTLGKESTDIIKKIDEISKELEKYDNKINNLKNNIEEVENRISDIKNSFSDKCWKLKLKYEKLFEEAFTGFRGKKEKFMLKCIEEAENNNSNLYSLEDLKKRIETVFKGTKEKFETIEPINYNSIYEVDEIFGRKIIGKKDIDIAKLIDNLNISDWVQKGYHYLSHTEGICPFCQQVLSEDFKKRLEEYFDETYTDHINVLNEISEKYNDEVLEVIKIINSLTEIDIPFFDKERVIKISEIIFSKFSENKQKIQRKKDEPSNSINLSSIDSYIKQINEEIIMANKRIIEHNKLIDNLKEEKIKLIKDIWRFIVEENTVDYTFYINELKKENTTKDGMNDSLSQLKDFKNNLKAEAIELQNQLTSVLPSINEINNLLKSYGFTNFKLAESEEKGNYKIIRENGEEGHETLSEGEMTFITFLYFYQLINGNNDKDKINTKRVIVIDDPISSLDSNVLFIVSHLINGIKKKIRENNSMFKQLIVLTHNVYFHKEITFNKGKGNQKLKDETFWVLTKENNVTKIKEYSENPIKNSYELLWKELKENLTSITTPNIMRRILENYFNFFGNLNIEEIIEGFPDEDKILCNSLLSWAHDGSHHINDDLFVDSNSEFNKKYFNVFRKIFINSGHESHFNMMIGNSFEFIFEGENTKAFAIKEIQDSIKQVAGSSDYNFTDKM